MLIFFLQFLKLQLIYENLLFTFFLISLSLYFVLGPHRGPLEGPRPSVARQNSASLATEP